MVTPQTRSRNDKLEQLVAVIAAAAVEQQQRDPCTCPREPVPYEQVCGVDEAAGCDHCRRLDPYEPCPHQPLELTLDAGSLSGEAAAEPRPSASLSPDQHDLDHGEQV